MSHHENSSTSEMAASARAGLRAKHGELAEALSVIAGQTAVLRSLEPTIRSLGLRECCLDSAAGAGGEDWKVLSALQGEINSALAQLRHSHRALYGQIVELMRLASILNTALPMFDDGIRGDDEIAWRQSRSPCK